MDTWIKNLQTELTGMPTLIRSFVVQRIDAVCSFAPDAIKSVIPDLVSQPNLLQLDQQEKDFNAAKAQYEAELLAAKTTISQLQTSLDNAKSVNSQYMSDLEAANLTINQLQSDANQVLLQPNLPEANDEMVVDADSGNPRFFIADNEELHRQVSLRS